MIEYLIQPFVWRALAGGVLIVLIAAPLGCLVIWQRMAYFGDALAHSALLGVALGLILGVNPDWSVPACCIVIGFLLAFMQQHRRLGNELAIDAQLGIIAHAGLAGGLVLLSFAGNPRFDLEAYLFGDVLTVTFGDIVRMLIVVAVLMLVLVKTWKPLVLLTISREIAQVEGVAVERLRLLYILMLAVTVATAIQIVGVLLTASLLIVPAAAARRLSRTPEQMVLFATLLGVVAVTAGILISLFWDLPAGPSIVLTAVLLFVLVQFKRHA